MFPRKAYIWMVLLTVFVASSWALASPTWFVRTWQSDEGLPDNTVMGIDQKSDGFLWVATRTGLVRFDGLHFREFPLQVSALEERMIQTLCTDRRGRVWVAKGKGAIVCLEQGRTTMVIPPNKTNAYQQVQMLVEDGEGGIWASFFDGSLARLKDRKVRFYTTNDGLPSGGSVLVAVDHQGQLWFVRSGKLGVFRGDRFLTLVDVPFQNVKFICATRDGGVRLGSETTFARYTEAGGFVEQIQLEKEMTQAGVTVLFADRSGRIWVGTRLAGLFCYEGTRSVKVDTSQQPILCMKEDQEGNIWIGTRGGGLKQLRPRVGELLTTTGDSGRFGGIQSLCKDMKGQLWAVTWYEVSPSECGAGLVPIVRA
jgi:ligand-binding sensor domain-containing protein